MSFVAIIEEKNPVEMHNKVYEASKNNALTPEVCMEVLSHTNVPVIMKEMLEKIEKLPIEEQGQYKEVILSMFDYRQTGETVRDKALEMAQNNGFESELNDVIERTGDFAYSARNGVKDEIYVIDKAGDYRDVDFSSYKGVIVKGEIKEEIIFGDEFLIGRRNHTLRGVLDLRGAKRVDLRGCNLSKVTKIIFEEGAVVDLPNAKNLPKDLDVSMCDWVDLNNCNLEKINLKFKERAWVNLEHAKNLPKNLDVSMCKLVNLNKCNLEKINLKFKERAWVNLEHAKNLPTNLDVSMCEIVDLSGCDLRGLNLKFREGASVFLSEAKNLPSNLDVSMCDEVNLSECDLRGINLRFKEGAKVRLTIAKNLPHDLDVSMCDSVNLSECDLRGINLRFKEGARVYLMKAKNLPKDLDVSMCDVVDLRWSDLKGINLKFREGVRVDLNGAKNLPKNLDVSMCKFVTMNDADISKVKELKFKNKKQMEDSKLKIPEGWKGKIVYTDDEKQMPIISKRNYGR